MFGKLRKNSVKIIVFGINIALAAVAVFAIRGKDQARLEENSQKENSANENTESNLLPSFKNSGIDYEFRTTVVPGLHKEDDLLKIGKWLDGSKKYVLQAFEDKGKILDPRLSKKTKGKKLDLEKIAKNIGKYFGKVEIRE